MFIVQDAVRDWIGASDGVVDSHNCFSDWLFGRIYNSAVNGIRISHPLFG